MASAKLVLAAQTNGKKSRGPVTAEGKRRSAANSQKHGLYGRQIIFDPYTAEHFAALRASCIAEFRPASLTERILVHDFALATARRAWAERALNREVDRAYDALPEDTPEDARLARAYINLGEAFDIFGRMEGSFFRLATRSLHRLVQLRKKRQKSGERTLFQTQNSPISLKNHDDETDPDPDELASYGFLSTEIPTKRANRSAVPAPPPGQVDKRFEKTYNSPDQVPFCKPDLL